MTGCIVTVVSTLLGVGSAAAAVDEGAGGSVGGGICPVHPTRASIIKNTMDFIQFERLMIWLFILILFYLT